MSKVTTENFIGVDATVVGFVRRGPENPAYDREGTRGFVQITIPIDERYKKDGEYVTKGTLWARYTAKPEYLDGAKIGDKVRIENAQMGTPFVSDKGNVSVDLTYGELTVIESADEDEGSPF